MMTFRKLSADSDGRLIRAYFTEGRPDTAPIPDPLEAPSLDPGGRLTSYYMGKDRRASWRPDMPKSVAAALGIDPTHSPSEPPSIGCSRPSAEITARHGPSTPGKSALMT